VAAAASLLVATRLRAAPFVAQDAQPVYTVIRRYSLDSPTKAVRAALQRGYIEVACTAPGFIAYFAVEDEDGDLTTVAVFRTQADFEHFASAEANWIAQNLGVLLPAPEEAVSGATYVHSGNPQAFTVTCPARSGAPPTTTAAVPTSAPGALTVVPATATAQPRCTGQGCACTDGPDAACDRGLLCCGTTGTPNGPGTCLTEGDCHPVCTSEGCYCSIDDPNACADGLVCCAVQSGYICAPVADCSWP
jgi:hypothetical protein